MTVQELIDKLEKVENKDIRIELEFVKTTWTGGCDTCGYGATKNEDIETEYASNAYDLDTKFVISCQSEE